MHSKPLTTVFALALLAGSGLALAACSTPTSRQAYSDCLPPAPNESGYGSRALSMQMCQENAASAPQAPDRTYGEAR